MGMVLVAAKRDADALLRSLAERGERGARVVGEVVKGTRRSLVRFGR